MKKIETDRIKFYEKVNKFLRMTDMELATDLLSKDFLFHKIPPGDVKLYVEKALAIGEDKAKALLAKNTGLYEYCKLYDIKITQIDKSGKYAGMNIRAEMVINKKERRLILYKDSIDTLHNTIKKFSPEISKESVKEMLIAHELFHFIEELEHERVNELLPKISIMKILKWERKSTILTLSEVAAHSFCKSILKLKYYPYLYDKLYALAL